MVRSAVPGGTPTPLEALPWGSMSMSSVRRSAAARLAARFTAVVVLPTPPFWLAIAMIWGPGMRVEGARVASLGPRSPRYYSKQEPDWSCANARAAFGRCFAAVVPCAVSEARARGTQRAPFVGGLAL